MSEFVVGELETTKFVFCGWNLEQKEDGSIKIDLAHAIDNLEDKQVDMKELKKMKKDELLSDAWQKKFRSIVGSLNWLAISALPEISFRVMILSTKFGSAEVHDMKKAVKLLNAVRLMDSTITFPAMGRTGTLKVRSFGDAAFGNIPDKDPAKDRVYSTVGSWFVWKERMEPQVSYLGLQRNLSESPSLH
jgi:hypothetical protein